MQHRKIKVLLAKAGLDGHDRGVVLVAMGLRDAGMEVVYLGRHLSPQQIVSAAVQEDVDVVGVSLLSDAHRTLVPRIVQGLRERGASDVLLLLGGFIQPEDIPFLKQSGVAEVFGPGTELRSIVEFIHDHVRPRTPASST
ncbi:MAG: cobalamin B12-binding domain-containing protein [Chloroflexi bacterium]|nr:cobalamin B12-binding domain-containing protein [Chloroflexota bacterium]